MDATEEVQESSYIDKENIISKYFFDSGYNVRPPKYVHLAPNTVIRVPVWTLTDTVLLPGCTMPLKGGERKLEYTKTFARVEYYDEEEEEEEVHEDEGALSGEEVVPLIIPEPASTNVLPVQPLQISTTRTQPTTEGTEQVQPKTSETKIILPDGHPDSGFYPTLGVVSLSIDSEGNQTFSSIGVTAEIINCALLSTDASFGMVVRGRQLFKVMKTETIRSMIWATVVIFSDLPSCNLSRPKLFPISSWPRWAIKKYDPYAVLSQLVTAAHGIINTEKIPKDPEHASYYVISNLVMTDKSRQELLELPTPIRLQKLIEVFDTYSTVCCVSCSLPLADTNEMFCMSNDMVQNAFVNKHGFVHDTITFRTLTCRPILYGNPMTKDSWYPGYAWTITCCSACGEHLGWLFTSTKPELEPKMFWGLSRRSLEQKQQILECAFSYKSRSFHFFKICI